jgi:glycosyltransferase involved in cell wall biosynthesis
MLAGFNVICFGPTDWWGMNPSCTSHIMRSFAHTNKIVYINPVSSDFMGIRGPGFYRRVLRKAGSTLKFLKKADHNFYVLSPLFIPLNALLIIQLKLIMFLLEVKKPILWVENIRCADIISHFRWEANIYHVSDRFDECPYTHNKEKLRQRERYVSRNSDLLICTSRQLYNLKRKEYDNVYYLPHGVDFVLFRRAAENGRPLGELRHIKHPIAGYFGMLTAEIDIGLLTYCALSLPEVNFVFVGHVTAGDYRQLRKQPNVTFFDQMPYEKMPRLCASFDVCLLPWKMTRWIIDCSPLKLFEYMAAGKPIVSVPIPEVADNYADLVSIAYTKEQFCRAIKWELENDSHERRRKRIAIAGANSWENHNKYLADIIEQFLQRNRKISWTTISKEAGLTHLAAETVKQEVSNDDFRPVPADSAGPEKILRRGK